MKYKGKKLEGRNTDILVLQKGDDRVVFKAEAIENYVEFSKLVPIPEPPVKLLPGGSRVANTDDVNFRKAMEQYAQSKTDYLVIKSLAATTDLEWEKVDLTKPETWGGWKKELEEAGFTEFECMRIMQLVTRVNSLDDAMLEAAKQSFLQETLQHAR